MASPFPGQPHSRLTQFGLAHGKAAQEAALPTSLWDRLGTLTSQQVFAGQCALPSELCRWRWHHRVVFTGVTARLAAST